MDQASIRAHCQEIERCNQRGGRMLSIVDLIEADTVDLNLAAFLMAAIRNGASFLVGANPGGAGKTTVMGALLSLVPNDVPLAAATAEADSSRVCYICHEISNAPYFCYLWGASARHFFSLARAGHMLATNLHADTYEQCYDQLHADNGVPDEDIRRVNLMLFLEVTGSWSRRQHRVTTVHVSDGVSPHRLIGECRPSLLGIGDDEQARCAAFLQQLVDSGVRTIQDVRGAILAERA
jgi:hypothetical protein